MGPRWDKEGVGDWLRALGLEQYTRLFHENEIDLDALQDLNEQDLRELAVPLGHRKRLLRAIREGAPASEREYVPDASDIHSDTDERRHLTILMVDLVDSTGLSAHLDPEDLRALLAAYHAACIHTVRRYDGHVARYRGDGLLVYFGWPEAHEDNAERAVTAGLELISAVKGVSASGRTALQVRVGIATGDVIVGGLLGHNEARVFEAFGQTPNIAARLEAIAPKDAVLISSETHDLVRNKFECDNIGRKQLKGFKTPRDVYRVRRARSLVFNFETRTAIGLTPLIGRSAELNLLRERWQRASFGEGQTVLLSGEPGIGKSRLVREFRTSLGNYPTVPVSLQCSPLHTDSPLHPVLKCCGELAGFSADEPAEDKLRKLVSEVDEKLEGAENTEYFFSSLFGIDPADETDAPAMSPEARRLKALGLLVDYIAEISQPSTGLVMFEDAHWMDPTTSEFLDLLIRRAETAGLLLIITFRPGFLPPWQGYSHQTTLTPNRLTRRQSAAMIDAMAGEITLPETLRAEIIERSDGNPLYIEELTAAVLGSVRAEARTTDTDGRTGLVAEIPATLQDSLHARLDQLTPPAKHLAQVCSIVGRRFSYRYITAVAGIAEDAAASLLTELVESGLLHAVGFPPEAEYSFKHALTQDAAYSSILRQERHRLHENCARALETQFEALCSNEPELLAHHWEAAQQPEAAIPYYQSAGQLAAERSALAEAETYLTKGLGLMAALPSSSPAHSREIKFRAALGRVFIFGRGWADPKVHEQFTRALELCGDDGDDAGRVQFEWALSTYHLLRGEIEDAVARGDQIVKVAERARDENLLSVAHSAASIYGFYAGRFTEVIDHKDLTLVYYRPHMSADVQKAYGTDRRLQALRGAALSHWCLGDHETALQLDEEQRTAVDGTGRIYEYAYALTISCILHGLRRDAAQMQTFADAAIEIGHERGFSFLQTNAENFQALGHALQDPSPGTLAECEAALANYRETGNRMGLSAMLAVIAEIRASLGDLEGGLRDVQSGLDYVQASGERFAEADLLRVKGELQGLCGDTAASQLSFENAITVARKQHARTWELQSAIPLARLLIASGEEDTASELLRPLCTWSNHTQHMVEEAGSAQAVLAEAELKSRQGRLDA